MNKISFKGSNAIIRDIVSRFFVTGGDPARPCGEARARYVKAIEEIAKAGPVEPRTLELLLDFLIAHGATGARLDELTGERADELVQLALDVETLRRYRRDGTILDVRVVDEWPF